MDGQLEGARHRSHERDRDHTAARWRKEGSMEKGASEVSRETQSMERRESWERGESKGI